MCGVVLLYLPQVADFGESKQFNKANKTGDHSSPDHSSAQQQPQHSSADALPDAIADCSANRVLRRR